MLQTLANNLYSKFITINTELLEKNLEIEIQDFDANFP